ncbi:MAG: hypothetical protein GAK28_01674 [Luteibacter sp.]|uniref:Csu type fimbrial protein n=1 Tax=Luteibacter sp. TaxID=1886636 RepID=UPI00137D765F|nr:spore coat protein U domain-containing protein [Luteibacter sp.]KAF1007717.1 MAG: hypothetical protein GAK28_01674 [Luteibacter sp.]
MKWLAWIALVLAGLFVAPQASATTTCAVTSVTGAAFGPVNPMSTYVDTTATINYSCTYTGALGGLFGAFVTLCASIGPDDLGNFAPRTMINANNDRMQYGLFQDAGRTVPWGSRLSGSYTPGTFNLQIGILSNGAVVNGSATVYGRVPAGQSTLSPGAYTAILAATNNQVTYSYNEALLSLGTFPSSCTAGGTGGPLQTSMPAVNVSASVAASCVLATATDMQFGNVSGLLNTNSNATTLVRLTCTNRAPFQVGLDNGINASSGQRRMVSALGGYVLYDLYTDSAGSQRWGNTLNTDTQSGTGSGSQQTLTVYGLIRPQSAVQAGSYRDRITVTVTY